LIVSCPATAVFAKNAAAIKLAPIVKRNIFISDIIVNVKVKKRQLMISKFKFSST
jgi:hypothetical protein